MDKFFEVKSFRLVFYELFKCIFETLSSIWSDLISVQNAVPLNNFCSNFPENYWNVKIFLVKEIIRKKSFRRKNVREKLRHSRFAHKSISFFLFKLIIEYIFYIELIIIINFLNRRCSDNLTPEDMELSRYIRANQSKVKLKFSLHFKTIPFPFSYTSFTLFIYIFHFCRNQREENLNQNLSKTSQPTAEFVWHQVVRKCCFFSRILRNVVKKCRC